MAIPVVDLAIASTQDALVLEFEQQHNLSTIRFYFSAINSLKSISYSVFNSTAASVLKGRAIRADLMAKSCADRVLSPLSSAELMHSPTALVIDLAGES